MKLSYRGVPYEAERSNLEVTEGEIGGLYRGQSWRFHYARHIPKPQSTHPLKYRGVAYCTGKPNAAEPNAVAQPTTTSPYCNIAARNKREVLNEITNSHLKNIQRSLEHRLEVARAKGDDTLIQLLKAESEQMALSLPDMTSNR